MSVVKQKFNTMQFKAMMEENKIVSDLNSTRFYLIKTEQNRRSLTLMSKLLL